MFELTAVETEALRLSLRVAGWGSLASLPPAITMALVLARHEFPGKNLLNGAIHLPLVLPPVVTGYMLLLLLGRNGPIGAWLDATFGIVVAFRWTGAAIAASVMAFPLMVRAIRLSLEGIDRDLEAAAGILGANPGWVFVTVTLPLALPGILAAFIMGFAKALGEFGATITFVSNIPGETRTLPLAIYSFIQIPGGEHAAIRLAMISVTISMLALITSELLAKNVNKRLQGHES